jgi:hypothetical protein
MRLAPFIKFFAISKHWNVEILFNVICCFVWLKELISHNKERTEIRGDAE